MQLNYDDATKDRLRAWKGADTALYDATVAQLNAIKARPTEHGIEGNPFVPRLVTFDVNGRDEIYVISWGEPKDDAVQIVDVCSVSEMQQRARLRREG